MNTANGLDRFLIAQEKRYADALAEIRVGRKKTHWMWYVFPQIKGLGFSEMSDFYALKDLHEATTYLQHPVLGERLITISNTMRAIEGKTAYQVLGSPDEAKLKSCMTLFAALPGADPVFEAVLSKFYQGEKDLATLKILETQWNSGSSA